MWSNRGISGKNNTLMWSNRGISGKNNTLMWSNRGISGKNKFLPDIPLFDHIRVVVLT
jgi:hypothetical protein